MQLRQVRPIAHPSNAFSFQWQAAFRKKGIRVNCVCPGSTDTDIYKTVGNLELTKEQQELLVSTHKQKWAFYFYMNQWLQLWTSSHQPILVISRQAWLFTAVSSTHRSLISVLTFYCRRPEAVAECVVDLIKDESTEAGQVVKVTYEDGVEYLNFNDVRIMSPDISLYWLSKIKDW